MKKQLKSARRVKNVANAVYCPKCERIAYEWKDGYRCYMCGKIKKVDITSQD